MSRVETSRPYGAASPRRAARRFLLLFLLAGVGLAPQGCDWNEDQAKVTELLCKTIDQWFARAMQICAAHGIGTPEYDACLAKVGADNTELTKKKLDAIAAYAICNEEKWESAVDGIKKVIDAVTELAKLNLGRPLGNAGQGNLNVLAARGEEGNYTVLPGAQVGFAFDTAPMEFSLVEGTFAWTLVPDGAGGYIGTVDSFDWSLVVVTQDTTLTLRDPALSAVVIDPAGVGEVTLAVDVDNDFLGDPLWWVTLPVFVSPDQSFVQIATFGSVPGDELFPYEDFGTADDCNANGILDIEEIDNGLVEDCNGDLLPDECQLGGHDCNGNFVLDWCEPGAGDNNGDGYPDLCIFEIVSADPPDGEIFAQQPLATEHDNLFDFSFEGDMSSALLEDFVVSEEGGDGVPPEITEMTVSGDTVGLTLAIDMTADADLDGFWFTITHTPSGSSVTYGRLPADVNGDGTSAPTDLLTLIDSLNGVVELEMWSGDVDRSGLIAAADVLKEIDLLNGAGDYIVYNGVSLP